MQDMWAGLLASSSVDSDSISPCFVETLKQMTPKQAEVLNRIANETEQLGGRSYLLQSLAEGRLGTSGVGNPRIVRDVFERLGIIRRDYGIVHERTPSIGSLESAVQMGDVSSALDAISSGLGVGFQFRLTACGSQFLKACKGPKANPT